MSAYSHYEIIEDEFRHLIIANVKLEQISSGHIWTEGPVWFPAHSCLLFSDIPNRKIHRWLSDGSVSIFREDSNYANGHTRDLEGRLVSCQHGTRSVTRTEHDGTITVVADSFENKKLNSPNDLVIKSDGSIWFTDPSYGILTDFEGYKSIPEQSKNRVYRYEPSNGNLAAVTSDFQQPNGLAFSPDEKLLYVAESGKSHDLNTKSVLKVFDVTDHGTLENMREFAAINPGIPDGLRVDTSGNVWVSAADGVQCLSPEGKLLGKILVPETVSNLTFGGPRGNMMFITATDKVYSIYLNAAAANGR